MANPATQQEPNKTIMESFVEPYYSTSGSCEIPLSLLQENLILRGYQEPEGENTTEFSSTVSLEEKFLADKQRYKEMRQWKRFRKDKPVSSSEDSFVLRLLSFNILAQNLLEAYPYLYKQHDKRALLWERRRRLIVQEILETKANVICLQEMQTDHLDEFLDPFKELGYDYLYKKRTNDKRDGLLFLYRADQFILKEHVKVELYQSGIELLSRDNVGIIAKLALKESPDTELVIATTHLLYNPKRNDVRLGQTQLLLAEIERIAFIENTMTGPKYLPIILSGDFNLEPHTGVYKFITEGYFKFCGKGKSLEPSDYRRLSNSLIPSRLHITDNCQHFNVLTKRLRGIGSGKIMLENTEYSRENITSQDFKSELDTENTEWQTIEITDGQRAHFNSGTLTHPFRLYSIYKHLNYQGEPEATTHQTEWVTVDYIFFSDVEPIERYTLPTVSQCSKLPTIPNFAVGSDHFCLGASFRVCKRKC